MGQTKMKRKQFYDDGWTPITGTFTYASATTINVSSGAAAIYSVGDKIRYQNNDSGTWLYDYVITIADTLLTVAGDAVPNATLTDAYYSKIEHPQGFPHIFSYTPVVTGNGGGTAPTYSVNDSKFTINGRLVTVFVLLYNPSGGTAGSGTQALIITMPVNEVSTYGTSVGIGISSESGGTVSGVLIRNFSSTQVYMVKPDSTTAILLNDQSSADRFIKFTYTYYI